MLQAWNLINEPRCEGAAKQGCPELLQVMSFHTLLLYVAAALLPWGAAAQR